MGIGVRQFSHVLRWLRGPGIGVVDAFGMSTMPRGCLVCLWPSLDFNSPWTTLSPSKPCLGSVLPVSCPSVAGDWEMTVPHQCDSVKGRTLVRALRMTARIIRRDAWDCRRPARELRGAQRLQGGHSETTRFLAPVSWGSLALCRGV